MAAADRGPVIVTVQNLSNPRHVRVTFEAGYEGFAPQLTNHLPSSTNVSTGVMPNSITVGSDGDTRGMVVSALRQVLKDQYEHVHHAPDKVTFHTT